MHKQMISLRLVTDSKGIALMCKQVISLRLVTDKNIEN